MEDPKKKDQTPDSNEKNLEANEDGESVSNPPEIESAVVQGNFGTSGSDTDPSAEFSADYDRVQKELLYLKADFDNYRKRMQRDQEQSIRFANEKIIGELAGVIDLFDKAMISCQPLKESGDAQLKGFLMGIEMTHRELENTLARFGVDLVGKIGEPFDPNRHEAISQKATDEDKVNTVIEVSQRGCALHGRLIRPARVVVGTRD